MIFVIKSIMWFSVITTLSGVMKLNVSIANIVFSSGIRITIIVAMTATIIAFLKLNSISISSPYIILFKAIKNIVTQENIAIIKATVLNVVKTLNKYITHGLIIGSV